MSALFDQKKIGGNPVGEELPLFGEFQASCFNTDQVAPFHFAQVCGVMQHHIVAEFTFQNFQVTAICCAKAGKDIFIDLFARSQHFMFGGESVFGDRPRVEVIV